MGLDASREGRVACHWSLLEIAHSGGPSARGRGSRRLWFSAGVRAPAAAIQIPPKPGLTLQLLP